MSAEEIAITNNGYTETVYPSCGDGDCTMDILHALGVHPSRLEGQGTDGDPFDMGDGVSIEVLLHGETDDDVWCAACGGFIQHGLEDDCGDRSKELKPLDGPHPDFRDNPVMAKYQVGA